MDRVLSALERGRCEVTGIPFDFGPPPEGARTNPRAPSLDRKVPGQGYRDDNIQVTLWCVNGLKGESVGDDFEDILWDLYESLHRRYTRRR